MPARARQRDVARLQHRSRRDQGVPGREVEPQRTDVLAGGDGVGGGDGVAIARGVLLDEDRVGTLRHRGAGEDADRLARAERRGVAPAGRRLAHHTERSRQVGCAHRVAVHGGGGEGRLRAQGDDRLGEHAAAGLGERHGLGRQMRGRGEQAGLRLVDVDQGARHVPERPPDFSSRRTPPITMPRSTALAMS